MDAWCIFALLLGLVGIVGSIVPGLPGPPMSWLGMLLVYISGTRGGADPMTLKALLIWLAVVTIVTVLDYVVPAWFTKVTGGHKQASTGAIIGLFVGMFLPPVGIIAGTLDGKVPFESTALPGGLPFQRTAVTCTHPGLRDPGNTGTLIEYFFQHKTFRK